MWMNKDESRNFPQDYDEELIKREKRKEVEAEIRVQVPQPAARPAPWHCQLTTTLQLRSSV